MTKRNTVPFGIWVIAVAWAFLFAPNLLMWIGGALTVLALLSIGTLFFFPRQGGPGFKFAVRKEYGVNKFMFLLLGVYYLSVVIAATRGDFQWQEDGFILKTHAVNILALIYGLFLILNPNYARFCIYSALPFLVFQAIRLGEFVDLTGEGARLGLTEGDFLGHTSNWEGFAMQTLLLMGSLLDEKNKIIKIGGLILLVPLYRAILWCGFATPVALFLIGHGILGLAYLFFGEKRRFSIVLKIIVPLITVTVMALTFWWITSLEGDSRFKDVHSRFKNFIEDPSGGGYKAERFEDSRFSRVFISLDNFRNSPVFGAGGVYPKAGSVTNGGHQAVIDYLAVFGLVGGGPFIIFVLLCIRNAVRRFKVEQTWYTATTVSVVVMFTVGGIINPCWYGFPMTVLLLYAQPFIVDYSLLRKKLPLRLIGPLTHMGGVPDNRPLRRPDMPVVRRGVGLR